MAEGRCVAGTRRWGVVIGAVRGGVRGGGGEGELVGKGKGNIFAIE